MSDAVERYAEKYAEKREEEARAEEKIFAQRMIARGKLTLEEIAEDAGLPLEEVKKLAELQPA